MGWSINDVKKAADTPTGKFAAAAVGGLPGYVAAGGLGDLTGANSAKKAQDALKDTEDQATQGYNQSLDAINKDTTNQESINREMNKTATQYNDWGQQYTDQYASRVGQLLTEAQNQGNDARKTYNTAIQPAMKDNMEIAQNNAMGAMSLQEAQDPNNALQSGIRGYFNDQSAGAMRQGGQSAGIADAFAGQQVGLAGQSGAPMTGAQQQDVYGKASQQGNNVRSQAMSKAANLQDQGIQTAQSANDTMYDQGVQAQNNAAGAAQDYQNGNLNFNDMMAANRGEVVDQQGNLLSNQLGNLDSKYATDQGSVDRNFQTEQDQLNNQIAAMNQKYGVQSGAQGASGAAYSGRSSGIGQMFNSTVGVAGKALGAIA